MGPFASGASKNVAGACLSQHFGQFLKQLHFLELSLESNAFEVLGNRRYEWKCNNLNTSSKNAAIRLGFKFEGVFRQMFVLKGMNRDTAWFSIIDKEWKKIKQGYLKYLSPKNFDNNLKQKRKLKF